MCKGAGWVKTRNDAQHRTFAQPGSSLLEKKTNIRIFQKGQGNGNHIFRNRPNPSLLLSCFTDMPKMGFTMQIPHFV